MRWTLWGLLGVFVLAALYWTFQPLIRSSNSETSPARSSVPTPAGTPAPNDPVLLGAGDIASCASDGDEQTANFSIRSLRAASQRQSSPQATMPTRTGRSR